MKRHNNSDGFKRGKGNRERGKRKCMTGCSHLGTK